MPAHFPPRRRLALVALPLPCVGLSAPAASHDSSKHAGTNLSRLGKVEFKVECASVVEADFNRAMALYHSFAWDDAMKAFDGIAKADPRCGMAHWGRAMVMLDNPFIWPGNLQPAKLNEVATIRCASRFRPGCAVKTSRTSSWTSTVDGTAVERARSAIVTPAASPWPPRTRRR